MILGESALGRVNLSLNSLRTVAAFLVVISHLRALFFVDFSASESKSIVVQAFYLAGSLGHPAVIVFFVLSGYWVGGAAIRSVAARSFSWSKYTVARLTRLWLVLIPAILLTQLLDRAGAAFNSQSDIYSGSADYHTVIPSEGPLATLGLTETFGNLFFIQSIHVATLGTNSPLWSLAYEFWYYALFPALLIAFSRNFSVKARFASVLILIVGSFVAGPGVLSMFPAWLVGAAIAWKQDRVSAFVDNLGGVALSISRAAAVSAVLGFSCVSVVLADKLHGLELIVALPSAVLVALFSTKSSRVVALKPLSLAAEWSYSLYAIHVPVLAFLASFIVPGSSARWQFSGGSAMGAFAILATVSVCAYGMSLVTERRTTAIRAKVLSRLYAGKSRQASPV